MVRIETKASSMMKTVDVVKAQQLGQNLQPAHSKRPLAMEGKENVESLKIKDFKSKTKVNEKRKMLQMLNISGSTTGRKRSKEGQHTLMEGLEHCPQPSG